MKIRKAFVTNSSSTSNIIISTDKGEELFSCYDNGFEWIDVLIEKLLKAKEKGATGIHISGSVEYDNS